MISELRPIKHQPAASKHQRSSPKMERKICRSGSLTGWDGGDVVIAGQITAGSGKRVMQRFGEFEIIAIGRDIEGDVAGVDDEIGALGIDVFADPIEVGGQGRQAAAKMRVGNLDQAKFGHAIFSRRDDIFG
jgi:hypothetical protein